MPELPTPNALHYTTDPENCVDHGGSAHNCAQLKLGRTVALYWSWRCAGENCAHARFHVWLVGALVKRYRPGGLLSVTTAQRLVVQSSSDGCFAVSAYPAFPHKAAESERSARLCIGATRKELTIKANALRGYAREYSILYTDNQQQVLTYPPSKNWVNVGGEFILNQGQSQANTFMRGAFSFDLHSLGGNSIFGGKFAYDLGRYNINGNCGELFQAPNGWKNATWIAPVGWTKYDRNPPYGFPLVGKLTTTRSTVSQPIDELLEQWDLKKPLALLLAEAFGIGPAESVQSGLVPRSFTCQTVIINPRLIIEVGTTV